MDNMAPRIGFIWDFTGKGKGKLFANWARYIETPLPLDLNVRAGSDTTQTDKNINVSTLNSPAILLCRRRYRQPGFYPHAD